MTDDCAEPRLISPVSDRQLLIREAFRLEWFTIGWMTVEALVAITAGVTAGSLVLLAFGLDSVIELASAGVLMWRLFIELRRGQEFSESAERTASRIGGPYCFCWRPMSRLRLCGVSGLVAGKSFHGPGLLSRWLQSPRCGISRNARSPLPTRLEAGHSAPTQSKP
jgi:hypothetical protein